jgi:uncharacterized protein (TIGR00251 family)
MVQDSPEGAVLTVHVQPKAARTEYVGVHGEALKFRVAGPPVDGAANDALCAYLAERLGIPKSSVTILAGQTARRKRLLLKGVTPQRIMGTFLRK